MLDETQRTDSVPVIDLFAGPGGLGEGFSSLRTRNGRSVFRIALSVEMDEAAHRTLELRAFYRQFTDANRPGDYYAYVGQTKRSRTARDALFQAYAREGKAARDEAWHHTLSWARSRDATERARTALRGAEEWVLVGGPPCQAYSLVGRSRRRNDVTFAEDHKHTLYQHYLQMIQDLKPPVFVMENVKGMLSAELEGHNTFDRVREDLEGAGPGYRIVPFAAAADEVSPARPSDFVIRAEDYGVPQARHRVILLGLRTDVHGESAKIERSSRVTVEFVLANLPRLRSRLSGRHGTSADSRAEWLQVLDGAARDLMSLEPEVGRVAREAVREARRAPAGGVRGWAADDQSAGLVAWYGRDARVGSPLNHEARCHQPLDLARYLFCASFAEVMRRSPKLGDFPDAFLPAHGNVREGKFVDRFRVQLGDRPATTVTSHISKDGHYYIHYDPSQCRSLSVREAARLQTFPDDYFFEGNRTQQYHQVGNAVPPYLARQLARVVAKTLGRECCE